MYDAELHDLMWAPIGTPDLTGVASAQDWLELNLSALRKRLSEGDEAAVSKLAKVDQDYFVEYEKYHAEVYDHGLVASSRPRGDLHKRTGLDLVYADATDENKEIHFIVDGGEDFSSKTIIHQSHMRFLLTQRAAELGLAPRVLARGPPELLPRDSDVPSASFALLRFSRDLPFDMSRADWNSVRVMGWTTIMAIHERAGTCLHELKQLHGGSVDPITALTMGLGILDSLERLHTEARIVHGNLVPEFICLNSQGNFVFTSFTNGYFIVPGSVSEEHIFEAYDRPFSLKYHEFSSLGEKKDIAMTRTSDELFSLIALASWLMQPEGGSLPSPETASIEAWAAWHDKTLLALPTEGLSTSDREEIAQICASLRAVAHADESWDTPYGFVRDGFTRMIDVLRNGIDRL